MDHLPHPYKLPIEEDDLLLNYDILDRILLGASCHSDDDLSIHGHSPLMVRTL